MANPIFQNQNQNPLSMIQKFNEFKQMMSGQDANKMLNDLISSGKVTQQQVEQAKMMANQFKGFLK